MSVVLLSLILAGPMTGAVEPAAPASAVQTRPRNIPVGDPLRRPLLDALRPSIQRDLGGTAVQFVVSRLRVQGDWAFFDGSVQRADGGAINFARTHYASALENGVFDGPGTFALLRRTGGRWTVVTFIIGPTDVAYLGWPDEHSAPASLFE